MEHECGMSEACPAWMCESMIKMRKIGERIEELNIEIANLRLEDDKEKDDPEEDPEEPAIRTQVGGCSNLPVPEHNNLQRISPIKMLIDKFENWKANPPKHPQGWNAIKTKSNSVSRMINKMKIQTIGGGELNECQPGNTKLRHTGTLPTPKQEQILNTLLAPKHQTKLPTQNKQDVKRIKKKIWTRLNLVGRQSLSLQFLLVEIEAFLVSPK